MSVELFSTVQDACTTGAVTVGGLANAKTLAKPSINIEIINIRIRTGVSRSMSAHNATRALAKPIGKITGFHCVLVR